jgi:2-polyprenyl-3-methyl-5-hydroxy-6-metoxy-1,4-benzoquinol methylase
MQNNYKLNLSKYATHSIIRQAIGKNNAVLDVGCNDGYIGAIADTSNKFFGLDYSRGSVEKAKQHYSDAITYNLNELTALPWDTKFDVIVFADVLEHLLLPEQVLKYFVDRYLKKGGRVIISLPNIANWQIRLNLLFGRFNYTDSGIMDRTHLHLYTYPTAIMLAKTAGLRVEIVEAGASVFKPIIILLPFLRSLLATNIILLTKYEGS